mmetsp:Transcript_3617/g.10128  ORF Transcript_3617/g.10128 Transcript_3617/m.10128 type:complete len:206 (-) Transcript_3617:524-1141(-)
MHARAPCVGTVLCLQPCPPRAAVLPAQSAARPCFSSIPTLTCPEPSVWPCLPSIPPLTRPESRCFTPFPMHTPQHQHSATQLSSAIRRHVCKPCGSRAHAHAHAQVLRVQQRPHRCTAAAGREAVLRGGQSRVRDNCAGHAGASGRRRPRADSCGRLRRGDHVARVAGRRIGRPRVHRPPQAALRARLPSPAGRGAAAQGLHCGR